MNKQRKSLRIQEKANVSGVIISSSEALYLAGRMFSCHTKDVSLGGIKMHSDADLPVCAQLELEVIFSFSPGQFLQTGNVIWHDRCKDESLEEEDWYNIGVRFDTVTNPWRWAVLKLLEQEKVVG